MDTSFPPSSDYSKWPLGLLLGTCFIVLSSIAALNYRIDPVGLFDNGNMAAAAARHMIAGDGIAVINLDDRALHRAYAQLTPEALDTLVLGSSRAMQINSEMIAGTLYNGAVSSATMPDLLAVAELFIANGKIPKHILIALDTWLLHVENRNERWQTLAAEYKSMLHRLKLPTRDAIPSDAAGKLEALISLPYSLETLAVIKADWREVYKDQQGRIDAVTLSDVTSRSKRSDGSLQYDLEFRQRDLNLVRAAAQDHGRKLITESLRAEHISSTKLDQFEVFLAHLRDQGIELTLLLPPFHPTTYDYVAGRGEAAYLKNIESQYRAISSRLGIPIIGSYDPRLVDCTDEEFFDGIHARGSCLDKIMKPMPAQSTAY